MTTDDLAAIEQRDAARTPGKWIAGYSELVYEPKHGGVCPVRMTAANLAFMAMCSEAVPALLAEVRRLQTISTEAINAAEAFEDVLSAIDDDKARDVRTRLALARGKKKEQTK